MINIKNNHINEIGAYYYVFSIDTNNDLIINCNPLKI